MSADPVMPRYLLPHRLQDWPALIKASKLRPPPSVPALAALRAMPPEARDGWLDTCRVWNQGVGPLVTVDTQRVEASMASLIQANLASCNGGREVLLINGRSKMGKSQAVVAAALKATKAVWDQIGAYRDDPDVIPHIGGKDVIPYIYVEAAARSQGRALLQSVFAFIDVPFGHGETTQELLLRLRHLLPDFGTRAIIVDDAHALRTGDRASRELTDALKGLITGTPCSFVFVGAGLEDSALLRQSFAVGYPAAQQIGLRAQMLQMPPWRHRKVADDWAKLVANLECRFVLPTGSSQGALTDAVTLNWLHQRCSGLPGVLIDTVKKAAGFALESGKPLSRRHLERVQGSPTMTS